MSQPSNDPNRQHLTEADQAEIKLQAVLDVLSSTDDPKERQAVVRSIMQWDGNPATLDASDDSNKPGERQESHEQRTA